MFKAIARVCGIEKLFQKTPLFPTKEEWQTFSGLLLSEKRGKFYRQWLFVMLGKSVEVLFLFSD
jgi:hypothetical protein